MVNTAGSPNFPISGPGFTVNEPIGIFSGGISLKGSAVAGNIYNVLSTFSSEPVSVVTANTASTVNVGNSNTVSGIAAPIAIYGPGSATTVNINDASDTTHSTATLDNASGNMNASYEVTGLSPAAIEYGSA